MLAEAILEEPAAWNYEEGQKYEAAEGLREHAEDFYKLAEKLLMIAWHGYERACSPPNLNRSSIKHN